LSSSPPSGSRETRSGTQGSLVSRTAGGDHDAFAALYDVLAPVVHGMLRRRGMEGQASEVVLEGIFLRIWREAPRAKRTASTDSAWVLAQIETELRRLHLETPPAR
jgi:RNA polymerase sigma-70 factor (ECF subfamily)